MIADSSELPSYSRMPVRGNEKRFANTWDRRTLLQLIDQFIGTEDNCKPSQDRYWVNRNGYSWTCEYLLLVEKLALRCRIAIRILRGVA
jgi:hypothetical protein